MTSVKNYINEKFELLKFNCHDYQNPLLITRI